MYIILDSIFHNFILTQIFVLNLFLPNIVMMHISGPVSIILRILLEVIISFSLEILI